MMIGGENKLTNVEGGNIKISLLKSNVNRRCYIHYKDNNEKRGGDAWLNYEWKFSMQQSKNHNLTILHSIQ